MFGLPLLCFTDSGLAFINNFVEECAKLGVRVEHSSTYNPSSQSAVERGIGNINEEMQIYESTADSQAHLLHK